MATSGRRMADHAQSRLAQAKSSFCKLKKKFHHSQDGKPESDRSMRTIFQLSDSRKKSEYQGKKPGVAASSAKGKISLVVENKDCVVVKCAGDGLKGPQKLPIMVVKQLEQMREECTSSGDDNKPRQTWSSLIDLQRYLAFSITYVLYSILPLQEKDLPAVQKVVANNIHHLAPAQLSSQPPPYQYIPTSCEGSSFYIADGGNGYAGGDGSPGGYGGSGSGSGSNNPEDDDNSRQGSNGEGGGGSQDRVADADINGRRYVCPFFRHDPVRYQRCLKFKLSRYSDVKQHINRYHVVSSYYCASCLQHWEQDCEEFKAHTRSDCTMSPIHEYLDSQEAQDLNKKSRPRGRSGTDSWKEMWQQFFPGHTEPVSPYLDTPFGEITQDCRHRNYAEVRARLQQTFERRIAAGQQPTSEGWDEIATQILDACLDTRPVEPRRSRKRNHSYANSTGSMPTQVHQSRPRNLSDPGPSPIVVPCENEPPATAPLMLQDISGRFLSVPSHRSVSSHNSSSARPFHPQITTQELAVIGSRNDSFSGGGATAQDSIFSATGDPQSQFGGADPSMFNFPYNGYVPAMTMAPSCSWAGPEQSLDGGVVAGQLAEDFDLACLPYTQPQVNPQPVLEANPGMIEPPELAYTGTGNTPHPDVHSSSASVRRMQAVQPKRKASKSSADIRQPTAKRGPTQFPPV